MNNVRPIVDLWPSDLTDSLIIHPIEILKFQGDLIRDKTNGHLVAHLRELDGLQSKNSKSLGFFVTAPGIDNYRYPLFKIEYSLISIYPVRIESKQIFDEVIHLPIDELDSNDRDSKPFKSWNINSVEEFEDMLRMIFEHPTTVNAVRALVAESRARGYDPNSDEIPF